MTKPPAFQFYPKDWLSSLSITLMTAEQEGGYIRLLCYCWDSGDCSLPENTEQLIAMARISKGAWEMVGKCFIPHPEKPGYLTNKKLLEILHEQRAWKHKSSIGGKKSAAKRAENKKHSKGGSKMVATKSNPSSSSAPSSATALREESKRERDGNSTSEFALTPTVENFKLKIRATRLTEDWKLPSEWGEWAEAQGLDRSAILLEQEKFRDHWISTPGGKACKANWQATWRNWIRRHLERKIA